MVCVCVVFNRVLAHADAGQAGLIERSAVGAAEVAAARGGCAVDAEVFKGREGLAQEGRGFGRAKDACAVGLAGASVYVEVTREFGEVWFGIFRRAEVLFDVRL